jgi:hypothetical protein
MWTSWNYNNNCYYSLYLLIISTIKGSYYSSHLTNEETETHRNCVLFMLNTGTKKANGKGESHVELGQFKR